MPRFRWFRLVLMRFPRRQLSRRCCLPAISPAALKSLGLDTSKPRVKVPLILFRSFPLSVCLSICRLLLLLLPLPIFTQPIFLVWTFENEMLVCNAVVTQSTRVLNQPPVKVSSKFFQPSYFIVLILASSWSLSLSLSLLSNTVVYFSSFLFGDVVDVGSWRQHSSLFMPSVWERTGWFHSPFSYFFLLLALRCLRFYLRPAQQKHALSSSSS